MKFFGILFSFFLLTIPLSVNAQEDSFDERLAALENKPDNTFLSAIIAVIVSGFISLAILLYREHKLEPSRWKKNAEKEDIENKLQAYGELKTLIEESSMRSKNLSNDEMKHTFEKPKGTAVFKELMRKNHHLYSNEITEEYYKLIRADKYFGMSDFKEKSTFFSMNLTDMQKLVTEEYENLKTKYNNLF